MGNKRKRGEKICSFSEERNRKDFSYIVGFWVKTTKLNKYAEIASFVSATSGII